MQTYEVQWDCFLKWNLPKMTQMFLSSDVAPALASPVAKIIAGAAGPT